MTTAEIALTALSILAVGGSGMTALLKYLAGSRRVRRETDQELWQRLVSERERAERERDRAENEFEAERSYVNILVSALLAAGQPIPRRPAAGL